MIRLVLLIGVLTGLAGCVANNHKVVASNDDFYVVESGKNDDLATLASHYLDGPEYASVIARYNPGIDVKPGAKIAIPKKNFNAASVFSDGYQTIPILCYHQFTNNPEDASGMVVFRDDFEQQMSYLKENGYQVIALDDVRPFLDGTKAVPEKSVVITIDDGYKSYYEVAYPILKKYGFVSTMFVYPDFVGAGLALKWKEVRMLDKDPLVDIQSHSKSHDSLSQRPGGEESNAYLSRLRKEVEGTDTILTKRMGRTATQMAYPYGNSSEELINLLISNQYELGLTVKKGSNASFASPYLMRRTMIYGNKSFKSFKSSLKVFRKID